MENLTTEMAENQSPCVSPGGGGRLGLTNTGFRGFRPCKSTILRHFEVARNLLCAKRHKFLVSSKAFTMAEILISLTIIGIIAAITLPALQANINEKTWATQRKALYSRMSQAISMMDSLNGYGIGADDNETAQKATQAFIKEGLSKVLKISNICDKDTIQKCGFPNEFTKMGKNLKMPTPLTIVDFNEDFNSTTYVYYSQINTDVAAFETVNGESVLAYYNPNCSYTYGVNGKNNNQNLMQPTMCANFIYDLNGRKGPNKVGKDIGFMTAFYPTDSVLVAPVPILQVYVQAYDDNVPFTIGYANAQCRKNYGDDARMANIEELKSVFVNNKLGVTKYTTNTQTFLEGTAYLSSSIATSTKIYSILAYSGGINEANPGYYNTHRAPVFCIKK